MRTPAHRSTLITAHFGAFPPAMRLTIESWRLNPGIRWLLVCDQEQPPALPENIEYLRMSFGHFRELIETRLGWPVPMKNPYKVCDFKPSYGFLFEEYLKESPFWGYCDPDIVLGRVDDFLVPQLLADYDIISSLDFRLNGPFTLFRNTESINNAFRRADAHREILSDCTRYFVFDEYVMTPIIEDMARQGEVRAYFDNNWMQRHDLHPGLYIWSDGRVKEMLSGREAMFFHYGGWKRRWAQSVPEWKDGQSWVMLPEGLFAVNTSDTSAGLKTEYLRSVQYGATPIRLNDTWTRRTASQVYHRVRSLVRSKRDAKSLA